MPDEEKFPVVFLKIVHAQEDARYCKLINDFLIPLINQGQLITYYESEDGRELIMQSKDGRNYKGIRQLDIDQINKDIDLFVFLRSNAFIRNKSNCPELVLAKKRYEQHGSSNVVPIRVGHFIGGDPFLDRFEKPGALQLRSIEQQGALELEKAIVAIVTDISIQVKRLHEKKAMQDEHIRYRRLGKQLPEFVARLDDAFNLQVLEKDFARTFGYADDELQPRSLGPEHFIVVENENLWLKAIPLNQKESALKAEIKRLHQLGLRENSCIGVLLYDLKSFRNQTLLEFRRSKDVNVLFYKKIKAWASIYEKSGFIMLLPLKVFEREEISKSAQI